MDGQVTTYTQSGRGRGISFPIRELLGDNKKGILIGDGGNSVHNDSYDIATSHTPINNRNENPAIALLRERMKDHIKTAGIFYAKKPPIYDPKKPLDPKAPKVAVHGKKGPEIKYPVEPTEFKLPVDEAIARAYQVRENVQQAAKAGKPVSKENLTAAREAAKALHEHAKDVKYPRLKAKVETPEQAAAAAGRVYDPKGKEKGVLRAGLIGKLLKGSKDIPFPHTGEKLKLRPSNVSEEQYIKDIAQMGEKAPEYIKQQEGKALQEIPYEYRSSAKSKGDPGLLSRPLPFSSLKNLGSDAITAIKNLAGRAKMDVGQGVRIVRTRAAKAISPDPTYGATEASKGLTDLISKLEKTKPEGKEDVIRQIGAHRALSDPKNRAVLDENMPKGFIEKHIEKTKDLGLPVGEKGKPFVYPRSVMPGVGESMTAEEENKELSARLSGHRTESKQAFEEDKKMKLRQKAFENAAKRDTPKGQAPQAPKPMVPGGPTAVGPAAGPAAAGPAAGTPVPPAGKGAPDATSAQAPAPQQTRGRPEIMERALDLASKVERDQKAGPALHAAILKYDDTGDLGGLTNAVGNALKAAGVEGNARTEEMHRILTSSGPKTPGGPAGMSFKAPGIEFTQAPGSAPAAEAKPGRIYDIPAGQGIKTLRPGLWPNDPDVLRWVDTARGIYPDFDINNPSQVNLLRTSARNAGEKGAGLFSGEGFGDLTQKMEAEGKFMPVGAPEPVRRFISMPTAGAAPQPAARTSAQPAAQLTAQPSPQALSGGPQMALPAAPKSVAGISGTEEMQNTLGQMLRPIIEQHQRQMIPAPQKQKEIATLMQAMNLKVMPAWAEQMLPMAGMMFSMMLADQLGMEGMVPSMAAMIGGPMLASSAAGAMGYDPRATEKAEEMWLRGVTPDQARAQMKTNPGLLKKLMARVRGNTSAPDADIAEAATPA